MDKITEPTIRVGMLLVDEETQNKIVLRCDCETLAITDEAGNPLGAVGRTGEVVALYKDGGYFFDAGAGLLSSAVPLRFVPSEPNAPITIANFDRRATRGTEFADNQFRHTLELRYNAKKDRVWVINELPIEMYLRGLAETSNASPLEYQKAIATAARSYAYYQWSRKTKYFQEGFTVDAYRDQVYKGYGSETRMPQFVAAVEATRGVVVTYDGQVALTTYFASSDGRTRSWSEVWRGAMPYLLSVPAVCDEGKGLRGHGVGMSATGAACQARQGLGWKGIMKSYYTGVDFRREW
jgi:stage II sporulation protein D